MRPTSDSPDGAGLTVPDSPPASADSPSAAGGASAHETSVCPVHVGQRWRSYQIGEPLAGGPGWRFQAVNVGMLDDVIMRVFPHGPECEARTKAWKEIRALCHQGLVPEFEEAEENGYRYEVARVPPTTTLHEWAACRQAAIADVEVFVRQIAEVLIALHDRGVVHLNLRPDTIFIGAEEAGMQVMIGGLEQATLFEQSGPIPIAVDPLYAPPEAAGLAKHTPGLNLRAWDWWSLGRIIQQIVLGRHVVAHLSNRDASKATPELRAKAEALLLERDASAPKAGAVESMPPMDHRIALLLRGLLASCRDGRWGAAEVKSWLALEPVKDRYQLARNDRLFIWKGRALTVPEAAEFFSRAENWNDGLAHLYGTDNPLSLARFIAEASSQRKAQERLQNVARLTQETPAWKELPADVAQAVAAGASWLLIGDSGSLAVRGRRIDTPYLKELLGPKAPPEGLALFSALIVPEFVQLISTADNTTARLLESVASTYHEVATRAELHRWFSPADPADRARLLALSLEPEAALRETRRAMESRYASTRDHVLQPVFGGKSATRPDLVLLAYTAAQPERFGFVTHEEWSRERYTALQAKARRLVAAIFWQKLERALASGPLIFGAWWRTVPIWGVLAAAVWFFGPKSYHAVWTAAFLGAFVALRLAAFILQRGAIARLGIETSPWTLRSGRARCVEEVRSLIAGSAMPSRAELVAQLAALNKEIAGLKLEQRPELLRLPPPALVTWSVACAAWALPVVVLGGKLSHDVYVRAVVKQREAEHAATVAAAKAAEAAALEEPPTKEDLFFHDSRVPLKRWDYTPPVVVPPLTLKTQREATPEEVASASVEGRRRLLPYAPKTVNTLIAVDLPADADHGLLLYDGRKRRVADLQVFVPKEMPADQSWFKLGGEKVLFLSKPALLPGERAFEPDEAALEESAIHHRDREPILNGRGALR